uniref:Pali-domain-containing protein n=1 Tax=Kwoniella bestiolae CBS 10118 TaxID=1296100 RepID=A0A1B9FXM6_9TREE|nr:hypothetical protein I302_06499 [Kwoniella bestiolae CBS 10118]OCF23516.1 hypothetical protein I302_06499 [Kwoniella bestiolae CBS 10118]
MGVRFRNATPGTLACLAATILLAVVSFNTPLLKSLNFLSASFSSGQYSGSLTLGTLGFCHTLDGTDSCTGPQVGYEFDPNDVFGVTLFDIPEAITKYLTYVLILHIVALAFAAIATIIGIFAHSPTFPLLCLSIWMAGIASTFAFLATVFDLAMFYIAKARINNVSGASAEIGMCVWLTLAAWVILALSGCFFGIGNCCGSCRTNSESGDSKRSKYDKNGGEEDYKMRMMAIDNERQRKQKQEQGLPSFQQLVKDDGEDKYLIERDPQPQSQQQGGLRRDGSVLQGVGMGYGRRNNKSPQDDPYGGSNGWNGHNGGYQNIAAPPPVARRLSDTTSAGDFVGVGAGGGGVDRPQQQGYGNGYYGENGYGNGSDQGHGYDQNDPYPQQNYNDPYSQNQQQYQDQYNHPSSAYPQDQYSQQQQQYSDPYRSSSTQPYNTTTYPPVPMTMPTPGIQSARSPQPQPTGAYDTSFESSDSHYADPGPQVHNADPYGGYDDGLGAIGMAVTNGGNTGRHERDYTGQTFGQNDTYGGGGGYDDSQFRPPSAANGIHQPQPQHLVTSHSQSNLLRSPVSPISPNQTRGGGYGYDDPPEQGSIRPPSYSAGDYAAGGSGSGNEKSSYRH